MKRILALMLVLATVLCLAACGEKQEAVPEPVVKDDPAGTTDKENSAKTIDVEDVKGEGSKENIEGLEEQLSVYTNKAAGIEFRPTNTEWEVEDNVVTDGTIATVMTANKGEAGSFSVDVLMELAPDNMELKEYAERVKAAFGDEKGWGEFKDAKISDGTEANEISCVYIEKVDEIEIQKNEPVNSKNANPGSGAGSGGAGTQTGEGNKPSDSNPGDDSNPGGGNTLDDEQKPTGEVTKKPFSQRIVMYKTEKYFVSVIITSDSSSTNDDIQNWFKPYKELEKK